MTLPTNQIVDSQSLNGDAIVDLYEIQFYPSGSMFVSPDRAVTWQGNQYQVWGIRLTGIAKSSDDETSRPKMSIANFTYDEDGNPLKGVFSAIHAQGALEGSTVILRKVLLNNLLDNLNIKEEMRWKVGRIASETPTIITLELRNSLDGPRFTVPARKFTPPEFSQVKLY